MSSDEVEKIKRIADAGLEAITSHPDVDSSDAAIIIYATGHGNAISFSGFDDDTDLLDTLLSVAAFISRTSNECATLHVVAVEQSNLIPRQAGYN